MNTILAIILISLATRESPPTQDLSHWLSKAFPNAVIVQKNPRIFVVPNQAKADEILTALQNHSKDKVDFASLDTADFGFPQDFSKFELATYVTCGGRYSFLLTKFDTGSGYVFNLLPERKP
jgi:uncharacterized protein YozE (UPF0346 family)